MTQQKTNKGCKGHYWTNVQNIEDMEATQEEQNIRAGSRVCVIGNAKGTCWETGIVEDINTDGALINHGSRNYPVYGKGNRVPLTGLEVLEAQES